MAVEKNELGLMTKRKLISTTKMLNNYRVTRLIVKQV
jgi:hypothetical protein